MLLELVHWVWVALVSLGYGSVFFSINKNVNSTQISGFQQVWLQSTAGILLAGFIGLLLNFWLPLDVYTTLGIGIAGLAVGIRFKGFYGLSTLASGDNLALWLAAGLLVLGGLIKAAAPSTYTDFGVYYIPTMRWAEHYSVVPGLANLHTRLGFNSLWHIACVVFNPAQKWASLDGLNEYLFAGTCLYFLFPVLEKAADRKPNAWPFIQAVVILLLFIFYLSGFLSSPTPDLAIVLYFWLLVDHLLPYSARSIATRPFASGQALYLLFLSSALVLIKISALPALALVGIWLLAQPMGIQVLRYAWLPALLLGAWIIRVWILTGYPVFPIPLHMSAALTPDWQVPFAETKLAYEEIKGFGRYQILKASDLAQFSYPQLASMSWRQWLPLWIHQKTWPEWFVFGLEVLGIAVCGYRALLRQYAKAELALVLALVLGWVFWFVSAPGIRFSVCYLVPLWALASVRAQASTFSLAWQRRLLVAASFALLVSFIDMRVARQYLLQPAAWPTPQVKAGRMGQYYVPAEAISEGLLSQCWDGPLPCAEYDNHPIRRRGPSLADGFAPAQAEPASR